jgi:hypothetical protein
VLGAGAKKLKKEQFATDKGPRTKDLTSALSAMSLTFAPLAAFLLAQQPAQYIGKVEDLPVKVAPQPIAFRHKLHVELGLECLDCHTSAAEKDWAGIPQAADCMKCHSPVTTGTSELVKLTRFHERKEKIPWVRVYRVPDFVFFSHATHLKADESCETCHGPVGKRDVLMQEVSTSMIFCMNCHAERKASNDCALCHQLGH